MKGTMKKVSIFMGVLAMTLFLLVAMASAGSVIPAIPRSIDGLYAVTGFTTCGAGGAGVFEGDYTFHNDGTGSAAGFVRNIYANGDAAVLTFTVDFTYEVTHEGKIAFAYPSHGFELKINDIWGMTWDVGPSRGVISPDGKTITITCGPPVELTVVASHGPNAPPPGATAFCVTTAVGVRLQ